ncbi:unnamed protein product, partial [Staurois parvus]
MDIDRCYCWGYTDHQGTLIISAPMISPRGHGWVFQHDNDPKHTARITKEL